MTTAMTVLGIMTVAIGSWVFGYAAGKRRAEVKYTPRIQALVSACWKARNRFSDLNGQVSQNVWNGNYEAIKELENALRPKV